MFKIPKVIIWLLLFFSLTVMGQDIPGNISQSDSAYYCSFFPMHVGDRWVYKVDFGDGSGWYYYNEIVIDTVDSYSRHWYEFIDHSGYLGKYVTLTDSFSVLSGCPDSLESIHLYQLNASGGDRWFRSGNWDDGGRLAIVDSNFQMGMDRMWIDIYSCLRINDNDMLMWLGAEILEYGKGLITIYNESGPVEYLIGAIIDGVIYGNPSEIADEDVITINEFQLGQNYPNPFNDRTIIPFRINHGGKVILKIYDLLGRTIYTIDKGHLSSGCYQFFWNGDDVFGNIFPSGIYIYELSFEEQKKRMKMILNK
jgi:hypothetical protein